MCFNSWFKDYLLLVSPPLTNPSDRAARDKQVAERKAEYDRTCGPFYETYQGCLQVSSVAWEGEEWCREARRECRSQTEGEAALAWLQADHVS